MKKKTVIIILGVLLVMQLFVIIGLSRMYVVEHDLSVVRCETINLQTEIINTFIDLNSDVFDLQVEKSEYTQCEEPIQDSIKIKLQELKDEK